MTPEIQNLEKIIKQSAPEYAEAVMHSYRQLSDMIARELTASPAIAKKLREAGERLKNLEVELINGVKENVDPYDRRQLVADFANKMDKISYDVIQLENKPTVDVPREKEHRLGAVYEKAEVTDIVEQYSHAEMIEIFGALAESTNLTEKQNFRRQQVGMLKEFLSTLHWEIKESDENVLSKSTWAERWNQVREPRGETHARILRISNMIQSLDEVERQIIEDPNKTVNELLSSEIKAKMKEFNFSFDKGDPNQRADIQRQYVSLIELMRSRGNYAAAQTLMEENLLGPYFKEARDKLSDSDQASAKRRARSKIGKMVNEEVLEKWSKEWTKKGIPSAKHDAINKEYIEGLVDHESKRQMNKVVAKENNGYPFKLHGWEKQIQEQYRDMMGYGDWHNFSDETWDMILNEVIVNAPMIAFSGGAAFVGRAALSAGAAALVNSGKFASVGLKIAEGANIAATASKTAKFAHFFGRARHGMESVVATGRSGKALYWRTGKALHWTGKAGGLLAEGAFFEGVHSALQGENLLAAPDWFRRILWSSATLGTLHFTAGKAKQLTDFMTKNSTRLFPDKTVRNIIMKVFVSGNITAGSMLAIGAIRHGFEVGDYDDFDVVKELFRSYILIGALHVGHGAVRVGGRTFLPGGGKPGGKGKGEARLSKMRKHEAKEAAGRDKLSEAMATEGSSVVELKSQRDAMKSYDRLEKEGYKFEETDGGVIARKGSKEIFLKDKAKRESLRFLSKFPRLKVRVEKLKAQGRKLLSEFEAIVEKGPMSEELRVSFLKRFAALSTAFVLTLAPKTAMAIDFIPKGVKDFFSGLAGLPGDILFYGATVNLIMFSYRLGLFGFARSNYHLWRLEGELLGGGIGKKMRARAGAMPGDLRVRDLGESLRDQLYSLHGAETILDLIRNNHVATGPLKDITGNIVRYGKDLLNILNTPYGPGAVFPQARFDLLVARFQAEVQRLSVRSAANPNGRLPLTGRDRLRVWDTIKLSLVLAGLILAAKYVYFGFGNSDNGSDEDTPTLTPPPAPNSGGGGGGTTAPPPAPSGGGTTAPPPAPSDGGTTAPPPAPSDGGTTAPPPVKKKRKLIGF